MNSARRWNQATLDSTHMVRMIHPLSIVCPRYVARRCYGVGIPGAMSCLAGQVGVTDG